MGVKPFYYYHAPGRLFAFASEIKALWPIGGIPDEVDDLQVARHLSVPVREDLRATYYRHIKRLLPGHLLMVTAEGVTERRYWALDAREVTPPRF
jgi:asparagine synthase (glutamine-hydrolysing)